MCQQITRVWVKGGIQTRPFHQLRSLAHSFTVRVKPCVTCFQHWYNHRSDKPDRKSRMHATFWHVKLTAYLIHTLVDKTRTKKGGKKASMVKKSITWCIFSLPFASSLHVWHLHVQVIRKYSFGLGDNSEENVLCDVIKDGSSISKHRCLLWQQR